MTTDELPVASERALALLRAGNERFARSEPQRPNLSAQRRAEVVRGQHPFAAILGCSDSRVPPEMIFDCGLGDLFVVRVAGNIAGAAEVASIEYAAEHLRVPLVVVLGHSRCGAVAAAVSGGKLDGRLTDLAAAIRPAVESTKDLPGDPVENATRANARMTAGQLLCESSVLRHLAAAGETKVVSACYDLDSGRVEWL